MGDFGGGFNTGDFFSGILASIVSVVNAIVAALNYMWKVLVEAINFAWNALLAVAKVLVNAVKLIARGFVHVLSDIVHGRFLHLFQDYLDLKAKLTQWLAPVLRILMRIRQLFNQFVLAPLLRFINMIQHLRQFLVVFRLLGFKWAKRLDDSLVKLEQKVVTNTLVLQAWVNLAITAIDLMIDPSLIFRRNFLAASLLSFLGAVKRVVFFGHNRLLSADEKHEVDQAAHLFDKHTELVHGNAQTGFVYHPFVNEAIAGIDAEIAQYQAKGSFA